jgi:hypothetical protein
MGCLECIVCQKRLRLSLKVDECTPLLVGLSGLSLIDHPPPGINLVI